MADPAETPVPAELREAAAACKRRISNQFMLVDPAGARTHVGGGPFTVTRKIDGLMVCAFFRDGALTLVGTGGRNHSSAPCASALAAAMGKAGVASATVVCELYATVAKGRPRVGYALSALADAGRADNLRLAPFDLQELDGAPWCPAGGYRETYAKLAGIFTDDAVRPVEMREAASIDDIEAIYAQWVEDEGAEGLVIHSDDSPIVWKLKPRHTIDAVVVGYTVTGLGIRDILFAVRHEDGEYRVAGATGGLAQEMRVGLLERLRALDAPSELVQVDSRGIAYKMVRPEIVVELSVGEFVAEDSSGKPKYNVLATFDGERGWVPSGRAPGVSLLRAVFERVRDDKAADPVSVRVSQITDICPFSGRGASAGALPKSTVLARRVFRKESAGKVMVQKFLVWQTNKEADPRYPAFVYHYTDYSSGRKDPLKRDIRISSDKAQIMSFFEADIAANVKKGWLEVGGKA